MLKVRPAHHPEEAWRVFEGSGYVQRWAPPGALHRLHEAFSWEPWPAEFPRLIEIAELDGRVVGTVGAVEEGPGWWLLQHLAKELDCIHPNVTVDLVSSICLHAAAAGGHHFTIFAERDAAHTRRLFTNFARQFKHSGSKLSDVTLWRCGTDAPDAPADIPALMACRCAPPAANLTGLGQRCRFAVPWRTTEERLDQLDRAKAYYSAQGVPCFTFVDIYDDKPVPGDYACVGPGIEWVFDLQTMGAWLEYLRGIRRA
jgi:hypothetical protein